MKELWKAIPEYEEYSVSNLGNVVSRKFLKERVLKTGYNQYGHQWVILHKFGTSTKWYIHRLVLFCFIGECPEKLYAVHLDGNPKNNKLNNLKYATPSENQLHRANHGTINRGDKRGSKNGMSKLNEVQVLKIKEMLNEKVHYRKIAKLFCVNHGTIHSIKTNRNWSWLSL